MQSTNCIIGTFSRLNLNLEVLVFDGRVKLEHSEKNHSEPRTIIHNKVNPHMTPSPEVEPGDIGGRQVLSPLHHPCSLPSLMLWFKFVFGRKIFNGKFSFMSIM